MKTIIMAVLICSACFGGTSFRWYPSFKGAGQSQYTTNWLDMFQAFQADVCTNIGAIIDNGAIPFAKLGGTAPYAQSTNIVSAGDGLTGGGDLSANRTLTVGAGYGISVAADAVAVNTSQVATLVHLAAATNTLASRAEVDGRTNALGISMVALSNALAQGTIRVGGGTWYGNMYMTNGVMLAGADGGAGGSGASITMRSGHAGAGGAFGGNFVIDAGFGGAGYGSVYVRHLAPPSTNTDAATKEYADSAARPLRGPMSVTNSQTGTSAASFASLVDGSLTLSNSAYDGAQSARILVQTSSGGLTFLNASTGGLTAASVGPPTIATHAATRWYVDNERAMMGSISFTNASSANGVDFYNPDSAGVSLRAGGDETSPILEVYDTNGVNHARVRTATPLDAADAATKGYVDAATNGALGNNSDDAYIRALGGGFAARGALAIGSKYINEYVGYARAQSSGQWGVAIGYIANANGEQSIALGGTALGEGSLAGPSALATGQGSVSLSRIGSAAGDRSINFGGNAAGYASGAGGDGAAEGAYSFAWADGQVLTGVQTASNLEDAGEAVAFCYGYAHGEHSFVIGGVGWPYLGRYGYDRITAASGHFSFAQGACSQVDSHATNSAAFGGASVGSGVVDTLAANNFQVQGIVNAKVNMGGNSISNIATCTEGTEAVNKNYADSRTNTWVAGDGSIPAGQYSGQFALSNGASAVFLYVWTGSAWLPAQAGQ